MEETRYVALNHWIVYDFIRPRAIQFSLEIAKIDRFEFYTNNFKSKRTKSINETDYPEDLAQFNSLQECKDFLNQLYLPSAFKRTTSILGQILIDNTWQTIETYNFIDECLSAHSAV